MSQPIFSFSTTAEEAAEAFAGEIQGKNVLITGTSMNGIGFEAARVVAKYANLVIITGYNSERLKLSEDAIKKELPSANIRRLALDLSSLADVRKAAAEVNAYPEPIHVLIHNAAAVIGPFKLTVDNFESQMATDHIGPFLLTKLIAPKLLAAGTEPSYVPRVVFLSSEGHAHGPGVNFSTIRRPDPAKYEPLDRYFQAKSANVLTAIELCKRSNGRINAYSVDPGMIYTNILQKEESISIMQGFGFLGADGKPSSERFSDWKTIPQGAATTIVAAFDMRLNDHPGTYLAHCTEANKAVAPHSSDPAIAKRLWTVTEEIIGESFAF
ncbi:hypothetical protein FB451DRAFT_1553511 [Mycena latifolia]|nr:hypothetical protein FB451DRAFT_1553511 [Mycena latifolia]